MLRIAEALFPLVPLMRTKALELVPKACEVDDLAFEVADVISWATEDI
jgi:hypothetical protein